MVAWRANGSGVQSGFPATSVSVGEPASSVDGELHMFAFNVSDATGHNLAASGWSDITVTPVIVGGVDYDFIVAFKVRSGSSAFSFSWTNNGFASGVIVAFNGQNTTDAIESITAGTAVASTDKVAPSVSSTYDNSLCVDAYMEDDFTAWTPDADFTERYDGSTGTGIGIATRQLSASGSTGTDTHVSGGSNGGIAVRIIMVDDTPTGGGGATIRRYSLATLGVG